MARKKSKRKIEHKHTKRLVYVKFAIVSFLIIMLSLIAFLIYHYTKSTPEGETIHTNPNSGNTQPWWKTYTPVHRVGSGADDFLIEYGNEYSNSGTSVNHPSWVQMRVSSKPVLILAHSNSCAPCVQQSEDAKKVIAKYGSEFDFVDILTDSSDYSMQQMVQDVYSVYPDPAYPNSIPLTIIITKVNRNGIEIGWQSYVGATGYNILETWVKDAIYYYKSVTSGREIPTEQFIFCELFDSGDREICDCSANATDALYMLKNEYNSIIMLDCPTFGELSNEYCEMRASYYGIERFPMLVIDGIIQVEGGNNTEEYYQKYKEAIDSRLGEKSLRGDTSINIISSAVRNTTTTHARISVVLGDGAYRQGLTLHSVLYVKELEFGKIRRYVAKNEVCNFMLNSTRIQEFNLAFSHPYADVNTTLGLCTFVQDSLTKEIIYAIDTKINYTETELFSNRSSIISCMSDFRYMVANQTATCLCSVTNCGVGSDVFVFSAEGVPDKWKVEFEPNEIDLLPNETKNITIFISPPISLNENEIGRLFNISIVSKPKGSEFGISHVLIKVKTESILLPDLAVRPDGVHYLDGKLVVYVHNYGTKEATAEVRVYANGSLVTKKESEFPPSSLSKVEFDTVPTLNISKTCIVLDEDRKIEEYDESNNVFWSRTPENTTDNPPMITNLTYTPSEPKKGDNVTFSVKVIDDDLLSVKIRYCGSFCTIPIAMSYEGENYVHVVSTAMFAPGLVEYHIEAKDAKGHFSYLNGSFMLAKNEKTEKKEDGIGTQTTLLTASLASILAIIFCALAVYYVFIRGKGQKDAQRRTDTEKITENTKENEKMIKDKDTKENTKEKIKEKEDEERVKDE